MKITVFHANECDRKKCTSIKMEKLGKCKLVYNINKIPSGAVVLNPLPKKLFHTKITDMFTEEEL